MTAASARSGHSLRAARVPPRHAGERLVRYLRRVLPGITRTEVATCILAGRVRIDSEPTRSVEIRVPPDAMISVDTPILDATAGHSGCGQVSPAGREARTDYRVLERDQATTLVELEPRTGRRHQIRIHLAHMGHPVVGDTKYGAGPATRLWLHAASLDVMVLGLPLALRAPPPPGLRTRG